MDLHPRPNELINWTDAATRWHVYDVLQQYNEVFEEHGPAAAHAEHRIGTVDHAPIATTPYRLSPRKKKILQQWIDQMLAANIIEESESPWAAPVNLVPGSDDTHRVCIDYRQLNAITVPDQYPLAQPAELIHEDLFAPYMSNIPLGIDWQLNVAADDQEKTAFITPIGLYEFRRMPSGLRNASTTFQRLMDTFTNGLPDVRVIVYLDSITIRSTSVAQHLDDLRLVLQHMRIFNLRTNRDKCHFGVTDVPYLGHIITLRGIRIDPNRIEAITHREAPLNVKQLNMFLQICSVYRRFIPNLEQVSQPLTRLTEPDHSWEWNSPQKMALLCLNTLLTTAPVLQEANGDLPFTIQADASAYALGAVLLQGSAENEHPIEYASRLLTEKERTYTIILRKALAVVWACERFKGYIDGRDCTIITDEQSLTWLMTVKSARGPLIQWALELQAFSLQIKHEPGETGVVSAILARPPCCIDVAGCELCRFETNVPLQGVATLRAELLADDFTKEIIETLETNTNEIMVKQVTQLGYFMQYGMLIRMSFVDNESDNDCRVVLPQVTRSRFLDTFHSDTAEHCGVQESIARVSAQFHWPGMRKDISDVVSGCLECQRSASSNAKPTGLSPSGSCQKFKVLAIDLFGPLPTTQEGYTHIFIVQDIATKWVELFPLKEATAEHCALVLLNEFILRYGTPSRLLSNYEPQFISAVLQKLTFCLGIQQTLVPVFHPDANPVDRMSRDLRPLLAIHVGNDQTDWAYKLPTIRFALNTSICPGTGKTASHLTFDRELRAPDDTDHDLRTVILNERHVPDITPHLLDLAETLKEAKTVGEIIQSRAAVSLERELTEYDIGDAVWATTHTLSREIPTRLAPRRHGPYRILRRHGPASYEVTTPGYNIAVGIYHTSALCLDESDVASHDTGPIRRGGQGRARAQSTP